MKKLSVAGRHIGIVAGDIWGSVHLDMALALRDLGCRVSICAFHDARARSRWRLTVFEENGLRFHVSPLTRRHPAWWWLDKLLQSPLRVKAAGSYFWALRGFLRAHPGLDALLVEGDHPWGWLVALALGRRRLPWLLGMHEVQHLVLPFPVPRHPAQAAVRAIKRWAWRHAHRVRAISPVTREVLLLNGCDPARLVEVPLPALCQPWSPCPVDDASLPSQRAMARAAVLAHYALAPDSRLLVSMCRLSPEKGLDRIARALPRVLSRHPQAVWLACGPDRGMRAELTTLLTGSQTAHAVRFCGNLAHAQVMQHLLAADLHLAPSYVDTFNFAVLHAACAGTASLVSPQVGCGQLAQAHGCARIVDGEPEPLAEAICAHLDAAAPLPEAARRSLFAALAPEHIARQLLHVLSQ